LLIHGGNLWKRSKKKCIQPEYGALGRVVQSRKELSMPKNQTFTIIVERDPDSGWLVGEVAELPGCYTQAPDLPGLETNIREAISGYLAVCSYSCWCLTRPK
jgi:predicted RNase H-like HicB family nuclease